MIRDVSIVASLKWKNI